MAEEINPIFSGKPEDFHWVGFGSGSGTNLRECAKVIKPALIFTDKPSAKLLTLEELADVSQEVINGFKACGSWKKAQGNPEAEAEYGRRSVEYNRQIVDLLKGYEDKWGHGVDLIVLGGYMRLVGEPLLEAYPDKIINVHPADLGILDFVSGGDVIPPQPSIIGERMISKRRYIGENAVYDAIKAGETKTRSSVIMVDDGVDHGEILTQGANVDVDKAKLESEGLEKYAEGHQDQQKVVSDWPAFTAALKMISEGRLALGMNESWFNEWRAVYLDGKKLPYCGLQVEK